MWTLALVMIGTLGVHLDDAGGLPSEVAERAQAVFLRALEAEGEQLVRDPDLGRCAGDRACWSAAFQRNQVDQLLVINLLAGLSLNLLVVDVLASPDRLLGRRQAELRGAGLDDARISDLAVEVHRLLLPGRPMLSAPPIALVAQAEPRASVLPALVVSAGAAALIGSVVFGILAAEARREAGAELRFADPSYTRALDRSTRDAQIAFGLAALGAVAGLTVVIWSVF